MEKNVKTMASWLRSSSAPEELPKWHCKQQKQGGKEIALEDIFDKKGDRPAKNEAMVCQEQHKPLLTSRLTIMVLVAVMLVLTTLLTWYYTSLYSRHAVRSLTSILRSHVLKTSLQTISCALGQVHNLSLALRSLHQQIIVENSNASWPYVQDQIRQSNWAIITSQPQLITAAFISEDSYSTGYTRVDDSIELFFTNHATNASSPPSWYMQNVTGSLFGSGAGPPVEMILEPYQFNSANTERSRADHVTWNIDLQRTEALISAVFPVQLPDARMLGASMITITVEELLSSISSTSLLDGYLYLIWRNGSASTDLIAFSDDISVDGQDDSSAIVAAASQYLERTHDNDVILNVETHSKDIVLMGERFYIDTMPLRGSMFKTLNLTAVIILPKRSIVGSMYSQRQTVIGVLVGISFGILVIGCFFICILTKKMSTEMQLRQELIRQLAGKQQAEQSSNYKSQFLANMSHELRTPMAGIVGLLDLLSCDALSPEQKVTVAQIRRCAAGLLTLVNNVLEISKVETGSIELHIAPFNLTDELESLIDTFSAQIFGTGIDITLDLADDIPQILEGDANRIRQIFSNLISNSIKFTEDGHIVIRGWVEQSLLRTPSHSNAEHLDGGLDGELHCQPYPERKLALVFEVDDTGCGIPSHVHETIFKTFFQEDSPRKRNSCASGLGLYVVKSLVQKMGGEIEIASKPEPGTLIRFHLILDQHPESSIVRIGPTDNIHFSSTSPDSLHSLLGSPASLYPAIHLPSYELLEHTQVLVAMPDGASEAVTVRWLERRGLKVTHIKFWEDIIPLMDNICKSLATDIKLPMRDMKKVNIPDFACDITDSSCSPLDSRRTSVSHTSEGIDSISYAVLAIIDVTLFPTGNLAAFSDHISKYTDAAFKEAFSKRLDTCKIPAPPLLDILVHLLKLHNKYSLVVGWIVPPDCAARFKQALQSVPFSLVMTKPLNSSRMRLLLSLLTKACRLPFSEAASCLSSDPSTPAWTTISSPNISGPVSETTSLSRAWIQRRASTCNHPLLSHSSGGLNKLPYQEFSNASILHASESLDISGGKVEDLCNRHVDLSESKTQIEILVNPTSPTSGLIRPGAINHSDGEQEMRKNAIYSKEFDSEWHGPVIDLHVASGTSAFTSSRSLSLSRSGSTTIPSTENSSPVHTFMNGVDQLSTLRALANVHVLLVEDTPVLQRLVSTMLKKLGARVTVVGDGLQAVKSVAEATALLDARPAETEGAIAIPQVDSGNFDLILMDCAMPIMDGYSATKAIRESEKGTNRHIPIVALTAHALAGDEEKCRAVGMDGYLTKPINCKQMIKTIQDLVTRTLA